MIGGKQKEKKKKNSQSKIGRKQKRNIQKGHWTRQCLNNVQNCHKQERKEKKPWLETHEAPLYWLPNQIFVPASLSCRAKQKKGKEKAETPKSEIPPPKSDFLMSY